MAIRQAELAEMAMKLLLVPFQKHFAGGCTTDSHSAAYTGPAEISNIAAWAADLKHLHSLPTHCQHSGNTLFLFYTAEFTESELLLNVCVTVVMFTVFLCISTGVSAVHKICISSVAMYIS